MIDDKLPCFLVGVIFDAVTPAVPQELFFQSLVNIVADLQ